MSITQTVDIPASRRLTIDVPREVPEGRTVLIFKPASEQGSVDQSSVEQSSDVISLPGRTAYTVEEAHRMAAERLADPNRKPLSRHFGTHPGIFGGDGVAYQRAIRDEWD